MKKVAPGIWHVSRGRPEKLTPVKMTARAAPAGSLEALPAASAPPFDERAIESRRTARGFVLELPLKSTERVFGFGLQLKTVDHTGHKLTLRTNADPPADSGDSHAPVPFYLSTAGYGVLVDTARYASFYCGSSVKLGGGRAPSTGRRDTVADTTEELYEPADHGTGASMTVEIPHARGADLYVFAGPGIRTAVQRYVLFSGGGCLPPLWGLGILYRLYGKADSTMALGLMRSLRENGMPCDMIGLEPGWHSHAYSCSYAWDPVRFPNPDSFVAEARSLHMRLNLWEHAFVHPSSPLYAPLVRYAGDYEVWKGLVPDLAMKPAADIFGSYHERVLVDKGVDGFKLDECDSSDFTGGWSFPNCSEFPSGLDGEQMHSMLGVLYQRAIESIFRKRNRRTWGQARSSQALAASSPFVLYSDLYDHRDYIRGVVSSGFGGLLWTPEVRACASVDDLVRRLQTVVLSAQACVDTWYMPLPPWLQYDREKNHRGELLADKDAVQARCRELLEFRMSLVPYLYAAFARYRREGLPPFRALVMDYPADRNTFAVDDQFMIGQGLMAAPVVAAATARRVYLPAGDWFDFWTNVRYRGGQFHEITVQPETVPLFVKEGEMLPLAEPLPYIADDACLDLTVRCYGEGCTEFALFEDDGITFDYEQGVYNTVKLIHDCGGAHRVERDGRYEGKRYHVSRWVEIGKNP